MLTRKIVDQLIYANFMMIMFLLSLYFKFDKNQLIYAHCMMIIFLLSLYFKFGKKISINHHSCRIH